MPTTALYYLPTPNPAPILSVLTTNLTALSTSSSSVPTPLGKWTCEHRVYRATPLAQPHQGQQQTSATLQLLHLSYLNPDKAYVCISQPPQLNAVGENVGPSRIPSQQSSEILVLPHPSATTEFSTLLTSKMLPLWTPRPQASLSVPMGTGQGYAVDDIRIRWGEVRVPGTGPAGGQHAARGIVISVEWVGDGDDQLNLNGMQEDNINREAKKSAESMGKTMVHTIWEELIPIDGRSGWGEWICEGVGEQGQLEVVKGWCEALRSR